MYTQKFDLTGRTAVVTGGGRSIGLACAQALEEAGAVVTIIDYSQDVLSGGLHALGPNASGIHLDVTDIAAVETCAENIDANRGVDVLVNCAGVGRPGAGGEDISDADWHDVIDVNLNGVFWCARAFGRNMLKRGRGSIVNIGSMAGEIVVRPQMNVHYNVSKAGVHHMTRSLAAEWGARGVRVNAIAPGFIDTPMNAYAIQEAPEMANAWLTNTPMARFGRIDEIASVALFLASDASSFMTGAVVVADGGYTLW
ncbi:NAD(P)-dependent dehydrogenase (short-subunit alcohol dehydrogenase family) [Devosia sp. UYZn731]|uniref:SDR family NAD(P)-dependent oxidoreductase n=1 Tax=Devosia sp. UYZn731 TaxID=3156345 RepID=UPI003390C390